MKKTIKMPRSAVRKDGSHDTEVSGYEDDGFDALCSCGWDTIGTWVKVSEDVAEIAAAEHVSTAALLADPAIAPYAQAWLKHQSMYVWQRGQIECSCGGWAVRAYPIGADTAGKLWLVHFAQVMAGLVDR